MIHTNATIMTVLYNYRIMDTNDRLEAGVCISEPLIYADMFIRFLVKNATVAAATPASSR